MDVDPGIRCALAQSCVNIILPTQTGMDPDKVMFYVNYQCDKIDKRILYFCFFQIKLKAFLEVWL